MAKKKRGAAAGMTSAIGGALVDLEQRLFRGEPRVEERHQRRDEATLTAADDGSLVLRLPGEAAEAGEAEPSPRDDPSEL
jgi:hypothetical protein